MKIAIIHDDFIQWGGAERLVAALAELFPDAPIYTSMVDEDVVKKSGIDRSRFIASSLDKIPFRSQLNKALFAFYPMVFESFDFTGFDLVVSSSTRFAHGIITKPDTQHIAYVNSPFRGFWEPNLYFGKSLQGRFLKKLLAPFLSYFRGWDFIAGQRPNLIIANSSTAQARIKKYYRRDSKIIFPFVDLKRFKQKEKPAFEMPNQYYVIISRLVEWKKIDVVVKAFNQIKKNLIVIGEGPFKKGLQSLAGPTIQVVGFLNDQQATYNLKRAKALIHPQKEDFGMTILEANACEIPVIAFKKGGALDTVVDGKTGIFFAEQTEQSLINTLEEFENRTFNKEELIQHAQNFSKEIFFEEWKKVLASD